MSNILAFFFEVNNKVKAFFLHIKGIVSQTIYITCCRKRTIRDILCENTDIPEIGLEAFKLRSPLVSCSEGNKLDINLFFSRNKRFGAQAVRRNVG
jgi:hypothetical protein